MIWGEFLAMMAEDGVTLDRIEYGALDEEGKPYVRYTLIRFHNGRYLYFDLALPESSRPVTRLTIRRIAHTLGLPYKKYGHLY